VFATLAAVLLTSIVFSLGGFINAMFAKNFDQISWFPTFVLTPLTYLGGVFYSIKMLPDWAQVVSHLNPILYMVSAFRYGFLGRVRRRPALELRDHDIGRRPDVRNRGDAHESWHGHTRVGSCNDGMERG
jgi:ABC-type polysaccharide/polyol phosphate export permease